MTPEQAVARASALRPGARAATRLVGGALNHVFRVVWDDGTAVLKVAPPHVASAPDIPLDAGRAAHEARVLRAVAPLAGEVRVPAVIAAAGDALLLEDLGDGPHLGVGRVTAARGAALGRFLRRLHALDRPDLANPEVQRTRLAVQYRGLGPSLARFADGAVLARRLEALGEALCVPGPSLVMGDLWPPSVLIRAADRPRAVQDAAVQRRASTLAIIDWELATAGRPLQDLAHLHAHLWLLARRGRADVHAFAAALDAEIDPWRGTDAATHVAAELLMRAVGPFADGSMADELRDLAVVTAVDALRTGRVPVL